MNIIIPMSGYGKRFTEVGYKSPKPLISVHGEPMFLHVLKNTLFNLGYRLNDSGIEVHIIVRKDFWDEHHLELQRKIQRFRKAYDVHAPIFFHFEAGPLQGAAYSILPILDNLNDKPIIIRNCDDVCHDNDYLLSALDYFESREADGGVCVFHTDTNPKWSFALINDNNEITRIAEKKAISNFATFGCYYFKNREILKNGIETMMAANDRTNNEFYLAPTFNYLIEERKKVIPYFVNDIWGIGTPEDLDKYLKVNG